ncbi:hypothetical protein CCY99_04030 [Helicobacter sp. 16-1353]|uniref:TrmH family RNA methyltransferase n=1 Tax=Helicobacter sp. 16-1353 TaxID=2004996 RepID=UPI000DCF1C31|nr:RNA methyltransferase [Helicobacter sp. 16-1353]RAX54190.1 hypothetical protein CCY99_04030 [Helicobacter sp. 16-1353]
MIIYGKQVCLYVLQNHKDLIEEIYLGKELEKPLFREFARLEKPIIKPDSKKLQALAKGGNHQGYILKIKDIEQSDFKNFKGYSKIVVLVGLSDVGNIGGIFRSGVAFGIDGIILSNPFNESGVARASSGAFFDMPYCIYRDTMSLINELKHSDFTLFGSSPKGKEILNSFGNKWALFLGSEGDGLPNKVVRKLDNILSIKTNGFDSLNVSVAAGILMYRMVNNGLH